MSNYTKTTNFATKDNLSPGNPLKIVKGTEIDTEFNNIATAVGTKTDNASANITGGSITGITDLAVADGGTGASTAANARTNLGLVIGTDVLAPTGSAASLTSFPTFNQNTTGNAATVTTNANLTGDVTSVGNATTLTNAPVIAKVLTGYVSGAGTVAATDSILQAIQKLNGNDATNANLTGAVTSVGNATSLGSFTSANLLAALTDETGTGSAVFATSPTLVTPALGTPSALVGTNITGTASGLTAGNVTTNANLTGAITSTGNATSLGSFSSANLLGALTDETGTGSAVFATSPTLVTPILGTPTSATLTNATGLPISSGVSGLGTGVATALAVNVGSSGAPLVNGGVLGTPSSGTATNLTGLPLSTGVTGTLPVANGGTGTATPSIVAGTNVTVTGTWPNQTIAASGGGTPGGSTTQVQYNNAGAFGGITGATTNGTALTLVAPVLGTPASATLTNATGLPLSTGVTGTLPVANGGTGLTTTPANGALDIGNGTGFTRGTLTAGSNITITNSAGGISIAAAGGSSQWTTSGSDIYYNTGIVGVGTTSPLQGNIQVGTYGSGNSSIALASSTTGINSIYFGDGGTGTDFYRGYIQYQHTTDSLLFAAAGALGERMRIDTNGNIKTQATVSVGGATPSTSGAGITFPATQSASTDANTLDDYEEGTWTPNSGGTATYSSQNGTYTKVGNKVTVHFSFQVNVIGTGSSSTILGLPFTASASAGSQSGHMSYATGLTSNQIFIGGYVSASGTTFATTSSGAAASSVTTNNIIGNGTTLIGDITYFV